MNPVKPIRKIGNSVWWQRSWVIQSRLGCYLGRPKPVDHLLSIATCAIYTVFNQPYSLAVFVSLSLSVDALIVYLCLYLYVYVLVATMQSP